MKHHTLWWGVAAMVLALGWGSPCAAQGQPRKLALLVAIDHYGAKYTPEVPRGQQWGELMGTVNDVMVLAAELEGRGFDVKLLLNRQATRQGIKEAFRAHLIDNAQAGRGDVLLFHYSGHGQQIPDDNGAPDEVDGYDEALVPFDNHGTRDPKGHLRDEALGALIAEASGKTPNVVVSLDSCHSGTGTRGMLKVRGGPPTLKPAEVRGATVDDASGLMPRGASGGRGYVLLSATLPEQLAKEITDPDTGQDMGAYTWGLVRALRRADGATTYQQLLEEIAAEIGARVRDQNPQAEGDVEKLLFSGLWSSAPRHHPIVTVNRQREVVIRAGRLHGLVPGTVLGLYKATGAMDPEAPLVRAEVVRVELGLAWARPTGPFLGIELVRGRALELLTQHTPLKMRVLVPSESGELGEAIAAMPYCVSVSPAEAVTPRGTPTWDVRLIVAEGAARLERVDGTTVPIPIGPEKPMRETIGLTQPEALAQALRVEFRRRRLHSLSNTDAATRAAVSLGARRVEAVAVPGEPPRIKKVLSVLPADGTAAVSVGDVVQFTMANRSDRALYVSIVELSADGQVNILYPLGTGGGENRLRPGEVRVMSAPLFLMVPPAGSATWKLIATEDRIDFSALALKIDDVGERFIGRSPLTRLMADTLGATQARAVSTPNERTWGTASLTLRVE